MTTETTFFALCRRSAMKGNPMTFAKPVIHGQDFICAFGSEDPADAARFNDRELAQEVSIQSGGDWDVVEVTLSATIKF